MASVVSRSRFSYRKRLLIRWILGWFNRPTMYDVFLWHIADKRWLRLSGPAMTKEDSIEFLDRFERIGEAVPVVWPVGVAFPGVF